MPDCEPDNCPGAGRSPLKIPTVINGYKMTYGRMLKNSCYTREHCYLSKVMQNDSRISVSAIQGTLNSGKVMRPFCGSWDDAW